jgi:streptogramin lyase
MNVTSLTAAALLLAFVSVPLRAEITMRDYKLPEGMGPHDVAPAQDGGVWFTAQPKGLLGHLDPGTGKVETVDLGEGSAPHGVIVGGDGAAWVTDGGANAIARVDPATRAVRRFPLPAESSFANLNTAAFDRGGILWFTGQDGIYGRLDTRRALRSRPGRRRAAPVPTASPRRRRASTTPRSPALISAASIPRAVPPRSSSRRRRAPACAAPGPIRRAASG